MCGWKVSVDDVLQRHGTPSQTEPASTPEPIQDQQSSGGPSEKYQCSGARWWAPVDSVGACLSSPPSPGSTTARNLSPPNSICPTGSENQCGCPDNGR